MRLMHIFLGLKRCSSPVDMSSSSSSSSLLLSVHHESHSASLPSYSVESSDDSAVESSSLSLSLSPSLSLPSSESSTELFSSVDVVAGDMVVEAQLPSPPHPLLTTWACLDEAAAAPAVPFSLGSCARRSSPSPSLSFPLSESNVGAVWMSMLLSAASNGSRTGVSSWEPGPSLPLSLELSLMGLLDGSWSLLCAGVAVLRRCRSRVPDLVFVSFDAMLGWRCFFLPARILPTINACASFRAKRWAECGYSWRKVTDPIAATDKSMIVRWWISFPFGIL
mmetsp:Transcript_19131/g.54333  ORF Transcript_19131/g.54333 Transcript_19131/m.54333 type:complete len:279 (-) Transcript_19131:234-1070(-)